MIVWKQEGQNHIKDVSAQNVENLWFIYTIKYEFLRRKENFGLNSKNG